MFATAMLAIAAAKQFSTVVRECGSTVLSDDAAGAIHQTDNTQSNCVTAQIASAGNFAGASILDVRRADEFEAGHCEAAVNIVWNSVSSGQLLSPIDLTFENGVFFISHVAHVFRTRAGRTGRVMLRVLHSLKTWSVSQISTILRPFSCNVSAETGLGRWPSFFKENPGPIVNFLRP
jgi:hypothetical protein